MKMTEHRLTIIEKIKSLENMSYMCANCRHEGTLYINDLRCQQTGNVLQMVKTCPHCGQERIYSFEMTDYKDWDLMDIALKLNKEVENE